MRIRHESLAAAARAGRNVEANRSTLREAGGTAAKGRASEMSITAASPAGPETEGEGGGSGGGALTGLVAVERLAVVEGNAGSEGWLKEVS